MPVIKLSKNSNANIGEKHFFSAPTSRVQRVLLAVLIVIMTPFSASGKTVAEWDFSKGAHGWTANSRVENLRSSAQGLIVKSTGEDPWIEGPPVDLPADKMVRVKIRMKSNADQHAELFYGKAFRAGRSVRFTTRNDGQWHDYSLIIREKLGPGTRFRLDPCTGKGEIAVAFIKIESLSEMVAPPLGKPKKPDKTQRGPVSVKSGQLEFEHYGKRWGNFVFKVDGVEMAAGYEGELIGLLFYDQPEWLNLKNAKAKVIFDSRSQGREFIIKAVIKDSRGGNWQIQKRITAGRQQGTIIVEVEVKVDKDRDILNIPWLTLFPGLGTFGESKYQGLFAGVEYLCDEPSSSDADIAKPKHVRRVPDPVKMTFPLMAIANNGNYIGLIWEPSDMVAATFDSPDRIYDSGAHVMALSAPAVGELRFENELFAHSPFRLEANKPLKVSMLIIGGKGKSVVPAVRHYVDIKGLPDLPEFEGGFGAAVNLLAHGWMDSEINNNGLFRHAVWGDSFGPTAAADAAMFIDWLANHTSDAQLRARLETGEEEALNRIPSAQPFSSAVSHVRLPTAPLIFGRAYEYVRHRHNESLRLLRSFEENGIKLYRPGRTDYSKTHFAKHANGLSGRDMVRILEGAALSPDEELINKALELLDKQTVLYADTVPRGAQTWEVPLHTPDILASAHMIKAYVLGYIISGKEKYLEQARYWAWTGVPFVYLYPPTSGEVGLYATIPVLGATNWQAPLWIGLPVQWCGLVYCSALHLLSEYDAEGQWQKIAKGITTAGLQMTWPVTDKKRQGLLPDIFNLRQQISAGPAINPGTAQAHLAELYGRGKIYDMKKLRNRGWFVHTPCVISDIREDRGGVTFTADGWRNKTYYVLISGIEKEPKDVGVRKVFQISTEPSPFKPAKKEFYSEHGYLIITLKAKSQIRIR
ncbi:MAG TPA: transposase [Planctomycetes bacterium]|nr:transposase [Planctomycetota bacterium]